MMRKNRLLFLVAFLFVIPFRLFAEGQMPASFMFQSKTSSKSDKEGNPGSSDILPFNGSYSYSVPLEVPPGINGLQPTLMLTYNSSSGNSWCGTGWDLSFGIIQRSTKNGIPKYDNSDTFVFSSGGSSQELTPIGNNEYRIKIDSSFMKFTHSQVVVGNQHFDSWTAKDKYGKSYLFGLQGPPTNSIIINPNNSLPFSWSLTAIIDKNGNRNDFYYIQDNNQIYLSQCAYGGKTITFQVEDRVDSIINCRSGFPIKTAKRLKSIETKVDQTTIKSYKVSYISGAANKSMLSMVQQYNADNISTVLPIRFSYTQPKCSFGPEISWSAANGALGMIQRDSSFNRKNDFRDVNVDGLVDHITEGQVAFNNGNGFVPAGASNWGDIETYGTEDSKTNYVDVNNDGLMEAVNKENDGYFIIDGSTTTWIAEGDNKSLGYCWLGDQINDDAKQHTEVGFFDITGDGLPDHVCKKQNENYFSIWVNLLGSFTPAQTWLGDDKDLTYTFINYQSYHVETDMVDINGDGLPDHINKHRDNNYFYVSLNMGDRFGPWEEWPAVGDNYDLRFRFIEKFEINDELRHTEVDFFDINGDGLPDHVWKHRDTSYFIVFLNQGDKFGPAQQWDANGDGLDLKYSYYTNDEKRTYEETEMIDINGDGLPDHVRKGNDDPTCKIRLNQSVRGSLLEEIYTVTCGTITVAYDTYIQKDQKLPFSINVVKSISTDNSLGNEVMTNYSYSGGLYDRTGKEFLGFAQVTKTDAVGNYTVTKFYQNEIYDSTSVFPYKGKIKEQAQYDVNSNLLANTVNTYGCVKPVADKDWYFPHLTQTDNYTNNGNVEKHTWVKYFYDQYGNVNEADNFGDYSTNTDDVIHLTEYAYNTDNYLVGYPVHQITRDYNSLNKAESWLYYDGAVTKNTAPVKGNVTALEKWLDTGGSNPIVRTYYDDYGNVIKTEDANYNADNSKGNVITTTYDTDYHTYPVTVTNILGHTSSATYDPGTGNVLTETDPNGQTTRYIYDSFGRITETYKPMDNVDAPSVRYTYGDYMIPPMVTLETKQQGGAENDDKAINYLLTHQYLDGFGRLAQTQSQNKTTWSRYIVSDVKTYNNRGLVDKTYTSFFPDQKTYTDWWFGKYYGNPADLRYCSTTLYTYDALGRVIRQDFSDGTHSTVSFSGWTETRTNGISATSTGQVIDNEKDAFGRIIQVTEHNNGQDYLTKYTYDTLGNLRTITNALNETTTITYDTLGRKTSMDDPKMGLWSYMYDANGNLTWQKDGKGQEITLNYDRLSRISSKVYPLNSGQINYTYDTCSTVNYGLGRLSKVTDLSGFTEFTYDQLGQVTSTKKNITIGNHPKDYTTGSTYNASGQQTKLTYPNDKEITYGYNLSGNLLTVGDIATNFIQAIGYNQNRQILAMRFNNELTTAYEYNKDNLRLTKLITGKTSDFYFTDPTYISYDRKDHTAFNAFLESIKEVSK